MQNAIDPGTAPGTEAVSIPLTGGTTRAAIASGTAQIFTRVLAVVLSIATARALEPREVGLLGLAVILVSLISMIGYYPETAAVVGRGSEGHEKYGIASVAIRALVTLTVFIVVALVFPRAAGLLTGEDGGTQSLRELIAVMAWVPILELVSAYPRVLLQRRLDLNALSVAALLQPLVFVGLAIPLLWNGYGYFGVAWANVLGSFTAALVLWLRLTFKGDLRWRGWPSSRIWRETAVGAARVFTGGFGGFLGERLDNLLVSATIGPAAMSYYSMAWNGSRTPANIFGATIGFVLVPTLSRMQDEPSRIRRAVSESLRHSYLLLAPVCAMLFVSAPLIVTYVLGPRWLPLVGCLRIMCVTVMAIPLLHACNALLVAAGRAHLTGIATAAHLVALVVTIPLFSRHWQVIGAAFGDLISTVVLAVTLCTTAYLATHRIELRLISSIALPIIAAVLAGGLAWQLSALAFASRARLASEMILVATGYLFFIFVLGGKNQLSDLREVLRAASRRTVVA